MHPTICFKIMGLNSSVVREKKFRINGKKIQDSLKLNYAIDPCKLGVQKKYKMLMVDTLSFVNPVFQEIYLLG